MSKITFNCVRSILDLLLTFSLVITTITYANYNRKMLNEMTISNSPQLFPQSEIEVRYANSGKTEEQWVVKQKIKNVGSQPAYKTKIDTWFDEFPEISDVLINEKFMNIDKGIIVWPSMEFYHGTVIRKIQALDIIENHDNIYLHTIIKYEDINNKTTIAITTLKINYIEGIAHEWLLENSYTIQPTIE